MNGAAQITIVNFCFIYLLLIIVTVIMKRSKINKTKLLMVAALRMTVQLVLAGFVLTYILNRPHPLFTIAFLSVIIIFSVHRVLVNNRELNKRFKIAVGLSVAGAGIFVLLFFIETVIRKSILDAQYTVPLAGMIIGNAMTGLSIGLKNFTENISNQRLKIEALVNIGAKPSKILSPFVSHALETALLPTLNSMLGMGIIFLPGMMTGQILSGTSPMTAIMYQIAVMIAICTSVCLTVFCALHFGYRTLYNKRNQLENQ